MDKTVSIVIPTYNERDNITPLVDRIGKALSGYKYDILFVDDDSSDGTAELISLIKPDYPLDMLQRKGKKGLASAVVDGIAAAEGEVVVVMDADLQHPPEMLPALLKAIEDSADVAIASRYVPGGGCEGWGFIRRLISKGAIFISHLFLPSTRNVKDPMSVFSL